MLAVLTAEIEAQPLRNPSRPRSSEQNRVSEDTSYSDVIVRLAKAGCHRTASRPSAEARRSPAAGVAGAPCGAGTFSSPLRFLPMMDTFPLLSFVATFLAGATAGAWLNALTHSYGVRPPGHSSVANG